MSQHDFDIANQGFAGFRTDLNNALQALASLSSGTAEPATTYASQLWYETDTDTLKLRNEANSAWLSIMVINQSTGSPSFTAGNVGIGTTSPTQKLEVVGQILASGSSDLGLLCVTSGASTSYAQFQNSVRNWQIRNEAAGNFTIRDNTASAVRVSIDTSGNVGIGTSSPNGLLELSSAAPSLYFRESDQAVNEKMWRLAPAGSTLFLQAVSDDNLTAVDAYAIGRTGTAINFQLWKTGGSERMRIASDGVVTITNLAGTGTRTVTATSTGVLAAASDSRLKQEVPEASIAGLAEIMQLRPVAYKWLDDIANRGDDAAVELGFFADEAKDIIPSAAPMGNDGYYGFYDRAVIATLVKAVQEQQAIILALEARLTAANL